MDPSQVKRTYDDIEAILGRNKVGYQTHETHTPGGNFRSYSVDTG